MIADYEDDAHFCLKCHTTILGLDNYVSHRKIGCSKNIGDPPKSPLPSQLLAPDESFGLKADDFFSSLELRSSSKKHEAQSTSGKNFSGILTRSKISAVLQATSGVYKDSTEPQQSKSGKHVWIGGHQLKELGHGDNQSKLIKAVANLERPKEEPAILQVYNDSDDDSEDYDYDEEESSSDDQDGPPRNYTGGKWKPSSPIQWSRGNENREWNIPPPTYTGGKWKPYSKRSNTPPASHNKGKWKPPCQKDDYNIPPPTFTGSKWVSPRKQEDLDIPPPTFTGSKWVSSKKQEYLDIPPPSFTGSKWVSSKKHEFQDVPSPSHTKGKWKPRIDSDTDIPPSCSTKGKWKPRIDNDEDYPSPAYTKGKWKPRTENDEDYPHPSNTKGKWKPRTDNDEDYPPPSNTKGKWKPRTDNDEEYPHPSNTKGKWKPKTDNDEEYPPPSDTKGKWKPRTDNDEEYPPPSNTKGKWKPRTDNDEEYPPPINTKGKWKPRTDNDEDYPPPSNTKGKWKPRPDNDDDYPPPSNTRGKWKPRTDNDENPPGNMRGKWDLKDLAEDYYNPSSHTKDKWKPRDQLEDEYPQSTRLTEDGPSTSHTKCKWKSQDQSVEEHPPPSLTKGKWKPKCDYEDFASISNSKEKSKLKSLIETELPAPSISTDIETITELNHTNVSKLIKNKGGTKKLKLTTSRGKCSRTVTYAKGKWIPPPERKESLKLSDVSPIRKSNATNQFWCNPCNRKLASKIVYERHLKSELHFKRTLHEREFDDSDEIAILKDKRQKIAPPEPIFSTQKYTRLGFNRKRIRRKIYERCEVCQSKVNRYMLGKHLISHYHCRKGDITSSVAKAMVLENIHEIVLESPFQCNICKFYCNTHSDFLEHWLSPDHVNNNNPGYFFCILCKYKSEDTKLMYHHLLSPEHMEVVSVINRSVPIVIQKIEPVSCPTCDKQFVLNMQLLAHCKSYNHGDQVLFNRIKREHVCDICNVNFLSNVSLKRHKQNAHKEIYYICTPCDLKFDNANEAKLHRKTLQHKYLCMGKRNEGQRKTRKCQYCEESFANFLLLKEHLQSKHPEHKIRCPHCGTNFTIAQELTTHLRQKSCKFEENSENSLRCEKCPFSTNSTSELIFHTALHDEPLLSYADNKESKSKPIYKYKCPICKKFFPKSSLQAHIRQHTQEKPFVCKICDAKFARKNNLQFHVKNHEKREVKPKIKVTGDRPFLCCMCGASFKKRSILQQHMQIHTGKVCKCPEEGCVYTARKMSEIKEHYKTHSNDRNFRCSICQYKGKTKQQLNRHMSIHCDTKKYQCPQCSFTSRNSTQLKRHARVHTGAKPFNCPHCDYRCNTLENLRKHVLSTNKHPGKSIYECKFCADFSTNAAREFRAHLVTGHSELFGNGAEAATYQAGIYDVQDDNTILHDSQDKEPSNMDEPNEISLKLKTDADPVVCQLASNIASGSGGDQMDQMLPMFIIPKDDTATVENLPDSWNLVGRYDVEEESGTLIPFQSEEESLFDEHF